MTQQRNLQSTTLGWVLPEECTMAALTLQMFLVKTLVTNSCLDCFGGWQGWHSSTCPNSNSTAEKGQAAPHSRAQLTQILAVPCADIQPLETPGKMSFPFQPGCQGLWGCAGPVSRPAQTGPTQPLLHSPAPQGTSSLVKTKPKTSLKSFTEIFNRRETQVQNGTRL